MNKVKVEYTSEWEEGGTVTTDATLNLQNGSLIINSTDVEVEHLIEEYVTFKDKNYSAYEENGEWKISTDDLKDLIFSL